MFWLEKSAYLLNLLNFSINSGSVIASKAKQSLL